MKALNRKQRRANYYKAIQAAANIMRSNDKLSNLKSLQQNIREGLKGYKKSQPFETHTLQEFQQAPRALQSIWFNQLFNEINTQIESLDDKSLDKLKESNLKTFEKSKNWKEIKNAKLGIEKLAVTLESDLKIDAQLYSDITYMYKSMLGLTKQTTFNKENRENYIKYIEKRKERVDLAYEAFKLKSYSQMSSEEFESAYWRIFNSLVEKNLLPSDQVFDLLDTGDFDVSDTEVENKIADQFSNKIAEYEREALLIKEKAAAMKAARKEEKQINNFMQMRTEILESQMQYVKETFPESEWSEHEPFEGTNLQGQRWSDIHRGYDDWLKEKSINWEDIRPSEVLNIIWVKGYNRGESSQINYNNAVKKIISQFDNPDDLREWVNIVKQKQVTLNDLEEYRHIIDKYGVDESLEYFKKIFNTQSSIKDNVKEKNSSLIHIDVPDDFNEYVINDNKVSVIDDDDDGLLGDI